MSEKESVRVFWNRNPCGGEWKSVNSLVNWRNNTEPHLRKILIRETKELDKKDKILEVGCGQGIEMIQMALDGRRVLGIDYSSESVNMAKRNLSVLNLKNKVMEADAENLPFPDEFFNFVYSIGVLHHTPRTQSAINEVHRVLKKDGRAVIMLYSKNSWKSPIVKILRAFSSFLDRTFKKENLLYNSLYKKMGKDSAKGTTLLELFGCKILKMYSKKELYRLFHKFSKIKIEKHSCNFSQILYFVPFLKKPLSKLFKKIDNIFDPYLGFHYYIILKK